MLEAGFDNFTRQAFSDLNRFRYRASFRDKARDVRTCAEIASLFQCLDAHADRGFFYLSEMCMAFHSWLTA